MQSNAWEEDVKPVLFVLLLLGVFAEAPKEQPGEERRTREDEGCQAQRNLTTLAT